jgi:hypothetical protein
MDRNGEHESVHLTPGGTLLIIDHRKPEKELVDESVGRRRHLKSLISNVRFIYKYFLVILAVIYVL